MRGRTAQTRPVGSGIKAKFDEWCNLGDKVRSSVLNGNHVVSTSRPIRRNLSQPKMYEASSISVCCQFENRRKSDQYA